MGAAGPSPMPDSSTSQLGLKPHLALIVASILLSTVLVVASPISVLAKCQPNRTNDLVTYLDGWYRAPGGTVGGVYSTILNYSPWVQPGSQVLAWVMLNNGASNWAQVGWLEFAGGTRNTFIQWTTSPNHWTTKLLAPQSVGSYTQYQVLYNNTPGYFTFKVAGSTIDFESVTFTPNEAENAGEILTLADQMPGGSSGPETFSSTNVYIGGWQAFSGSDVNNGTFGAFGLTDVSSTQRNIWDSKCAV